MSKTKYANTTQYFSNCGCEVREQHQKNIAGCIGRIHQIWTRGKNISLQMICNFQVLVLIFCSLLYYYIKLYLPNNIKHVTKYSYFIFSSPKHFQDIISSARECFGFGAIKFDSPFFFYSFRNTFAALDIRFILTLIKKNIDSIIIEQSITIFVEGKNISLERERVKQQVSVSANPSSCLVDLSAPKPTNQP